VRQYRGVIAPAVIGAALLGFYLLKEKSEHVEPANQLERERLLNTFLSAYYAGDWAELIRCCGASAGQRLSRIRLQVGNEAIPAYRGLAGTCHAGDRLGFYHFQSGLAYYARNHVAKVKCSYLLVNQTTHQQLSHETAVAYFARESGAWRIIAMDGMYLEKWIHPSREMMAPAD